MAFNVNLSELVVYKKWKFYCDIKAPGEVDPLVSLPQPNPTIRSIAEREEEGERERESEREREIDRYRERKRERGR